MATNESSAQRELIKALIEVGAHVLKITSINTAGIPDLYVKHPAAPPIWIELKFEKWLPSFLQKGVPVHLTLLQRNFIRKEKMVSGHAGVVVVTQRREVEWLAYVSNDPHTSRIPVTNYSCLRMRGQPWDVLKILNDLICP